MFAHALALAASLVAPIADDALTAEGLSSMIKGLGYEVKTLSPAGSALKFEFTCKTTKFNIPIAAELSPSGNYVWLTIHLGPAPTDGSKGLALLRTNTDIQPSFFYITKKDRLMLASPIDNRGITPTVLKRVIEKLMKDVDDTADKWK